MNPLIMDMISEISFYTSNPQRLQPDFGKSYTWHKSIFPPEQRRSVLAGIKCTMDEKTVVYYLLARWYEKISSQKAPCDFCVYRSWKKHIHSLDNLTEKEKTILTDVIDIGTRHDPDKRDIKRILTLLNSLYDG